MDGGTGGGRVRPSLWLALAATVVFAAIVTLRPDPDEGGAPAGPATTASVPVEPGIPELLPRPAFEVQDVRAMKMALTGLRAMEVYAAGNGGSYTGVHPSRLEKIDPDFWEPDARAHGRGDSFRITVPSASSNYFRIARRDGGPLVMKCFVFVRNIGACPDDGRWNAEMAEDGLQR